MPDSPVLNFNDQYLVGLFLRAMFQFEKLVNASGTYLNLEHRIDAAYQEARAKFTEQQKK